MPTTSGTFKVMGPLKVQYRAASYNNWTNVSGEALVRYFSRVITKPDRRRKPEGWLYPTSYEATYISATFPSGFVAVQTGTGAPYTGTDQRTSNGALGPEHTIPYPPGTFVVGFKAAHDYGPKGWVNPDQQQLQARAEIRALTKLKSSKVNLSVAAAEARKTGDMLVDTGNRFVDAAYSIRERKFKAVSRILKCKIPKQPGNYLSWRYGWTPFMMELFGAAEALAESRINPTGWTQSVRDVVRVPWYASSRTTGAGGCSFYEEGNTGAFVRLDVEPENSFLSSLASLGLTNPAELVWELLPLSFVADWFIPLGDWLHVIDASAGYKFKSGSCTIRGDGKGRSWHTPDNSNSVRCITPSTGMSHYRKLYIKRIPYSGFPMPFIPRPRLGINLLRVADTLALLQGAFRR